MAVFRHGEVESNSWLDNKCRMLIIAANVRNPYMVKAALLGYEFKICVSDHFSGPGSAIGTLCVCSCNNF